MIVRSYKNETYCCCGYCRGTRYAYPACFRAGGQSGNAPRWPDHGTNRRTTGTATLSFHRDQRGTIGCSETALLTIVSTAGTSPATADMAKLVDPWQWITALTVSAPVSSSTLSTARGWS